MIDYFKTSRDKSSEIHNILKHYLDKKHQILGVLDPVDEIEVEKLKDAVYRCILLQHIHWSFWGMIMIPYDKVETTDGVNACLKFYLEYAYARLHMYK